MPFEVDEIVFPIPQAISKPGWFRIQRSLFSAEECGELVTFAEETGRYYRSGGKKVKRDVGICYLNPENAPWAFKKIARVFARHNVWGFALSGIGGDLTIAERRTPRIGRGDCLFFPFAMHSVSPVTRGERIVLSAWAAGPRLV